MVKQEIVSLLLAAQNEDLKQIEKNRLNSPFKFLLLTIYFKDKFLPVATLNALNALNAYCDSVKLPYDEKENPIYRNVMMIEWLHSVPQISDWSPWMLMRFCDWLWRNKYSIDGQSICKKSSDIHTPLLPKKIQKSVEDFYVTCGKCGAEYVKANRCTTCGQKLEWPNEEQIVKYMI